MCPGQIGAAPISGMIGLDCDYQPCSGPDFATPAPRILCVFLTATDLILGMFALFVLA